MVEREALPVTKAMFEAEYAGRPFEVVYGEVQEVNPSGFYASEVARRIASRLGDFVDANDLGGVTGADGGYWLDDQNMRAPDAAFISKAKLDALDDSSKYPEVAPDLAVEVVSPNDRAAEIQDKVALYFQNGVQLVWVVYPAQREVVVHQSDRTTKTYTIGETLDGGDVLKGFSLPLVSIFPDKKSDNT
ncbi:MAG: Uma2 family endonuclease [Chloroflexota bacterium]